MKKRIFSLLLCVIMCASVLAMFPGCGAAKPDAIVIMTEDLDGVFNPFFSTTAADGTIISMTQIGMLTTDYRGGEAVEAYGDEYAVVVKDMKQDRNEAADTTTYTFIIKNGITFSDGKPLTIADVLFNMYVYLDPVYSGSSTMYSTDIVGLRDYRTQTVSSGSSNNDDIISQGARNRALNRINELINLFTSKGETSPGSYDADYEAMKGFIAAHKLSDGYKEAISTDWSKVTTDQLLADYDKTLALFKKELETDYASAKESYLEEPYKSTGEFDEVTSFMYAEGYVTLEYHEPAPRHP